MRNWTLSVLLILACCCASAFEEGNSKIEGADVVTSKTVSVTASPILVAVFLSATCPCSNSHLHELKDLFKNFPEYRFVGLHSNSDENKIPTQEYFKAANLPFPVVQDFHARYADQFKALKTPHAFVVDAAGKILYQGGVSSSRDFAHADTKFLRLALEDLKAGREVKVGEGRTLGCAIKRGEKNDW